MGWKTNHLMKKRIIQTLIAVALLLGLTACESVPLTQRVEEPTQLLPLDFEETRRPERLNRRDLSAQDAVALANWTWTQRGSRADYRIASRSLASALERGEYLDSEERMRLSVMCLQHATLARENEALDVGASNWEEAYMELNRIAYEGEIETYLVGCRLTGRTPYPGLVAQAHPAVVNTLNP